MSFNWETYKWGVNANDKILTSWLKLSPAADSEDFHCGDWLHRSYVPICIQLTPSKKQKRNLAGTRDCIIITQEDSLNPFFSQWDTLKTHCVFPTLRSPDCFTTHCKGGPQTPRSSFKATTAEKSGYYFALSRESTKPTESHMRWWAWHCTSCHVVNMAT